MPTQSDISSQITSTLATVEPDLDTSVGTTIRKAIDAIAQQISEAYADNNISSNQYSIDSLSGSALDSFVNLFGFARFAAKSATGTVLFSRPAAQGSVAPPDVLIAAGSQVSTTDATPIIFSVLITFVLPSDELTISVPVIAVAGGLAGNVGANNISIPTTPLQGIAGVTNPSATTGGTDAESDAALIARFKATIFRGFTGTAQSFTGTALENSAVARVNTIGPRSTVLVQVQITGGTSGTSLNSTTYPHIFTDNYFFGPSLANGLLINPGVDYSFTVSGSSPNYYVTIASLSANCPDGIYELQYDYQSAWTRNSVTGGIWNDVDVWTDGADIQSATEVLPFGVASSSSPTSAPQFTATTSSTYYTQNWVREDGVTTPTVGNFFLPLTFCPPTQLPAELVDTYTSTTYYPNVDYWLVYYIGPYGWSDHSLAGIEWKETDNWGTSGNYTMSVDYDYNAVPREIESAIAQWTLVGYNVWAHQANPVYLNFSFIVVLQSGFSASSVLPGVEAALTTLCAGLSFNQTLELSQVISAVQAVTGIRAVRMASSGDDTTTVASGSNGVNVDTWTGTGVLDITSAVTLPTFGLFTVPTSGATPATVSYTGTITNTTPNQLTGLTTLSGTGTISTGGTVQAAYSIFQTSPITGGIIQTFPSKTDISFNEVSYPVFNSASIIVRSQNTFRANESD